MWLKRIVNYDLLILVSIIWFLGKFIRYAFPPLFETLQLFYGVSNTAIGGAFTGFMIVYSIMQFPSGIIADRIGAVRVIVTGATVTGIGALILVADSPFPVLLAGMLILGMGTGVHKTVSVRLIARIYPTQTGRALGAHDTLGAFGGAVAPTAVVMLLSAPPAIGWILNRLPGASWRSLFLLTAVISLTLALLFALRFNSQYSNHILENENDTIPQPGINDYLQLTQDKKLLYFIFITLGVSFAHNGLVAFLPLYLSQVSEVSSTTAGILYSLFFWVSFIQLISGSLSDRIGRLPVLIITSSLATAALWAVVFTPGAETIVLGALIAGIGIGAHGFQPVRGAYLMESLPDQLAAGGLGLIRTLLMGAGSLAPIIVGFVVDVSNFRVAFGLLSTSMSLAAIGAIGLYIVE